MLGPIVLLVAILLSYAIATFVLTSIQSATEPETNTIMESTNMMVEPTGLGQQDTGVAVAKIINAILGLLGIIAVVLILPGLVLGIYFLSKKEDAQILLQLTPLPAYKGLSPQQIIYIANWSWGAFFGTLIWALGNKLYLLAVPLIISLVLSMLVNLGVFGALAIIVNIILFLFGIYGLVIWIYLSIKGRQLAWAKGWQSFEQFKKRQQLLKWLILVFIIIILAFYLYVGYQFFILRTQLTSPILPSGIFLNSNVNTNDQLNNNLNLNNYINTNTDALTNLNAVEMLKRATISSARSDGINLDFNNNGLIEDDEVTVYAEPGADADKDGLTNYEEIFKYKTNPLVADTDGDGYNDKAEIEAGYNPNGPGKLAP